MFRGDYEVLGYDVGRYLEDTAEDVPDAAGGWVTARLEELFTKRAQCWEAYSRSPDARNPDVINPDSLKKWHYAEADIIEFCLIFLGAEAGYAETVAHRYLAKARISNPAWVSNSAEWLAMRSSFSGSSYRAGAPGSSPTLNAGQELSPSTAVPSRQAPAQPPGQAPQPVDRAPNEGPQNEGEESGTRLLDDDQRATVCRAMMDLAFKPDEKFDEGVYSRFMETVKRFVKGDEEYAIAVMRIISSEFGVAVGDLSFEQVDQYMGAHPAMLEVSPIMQVLLDFRVSDLRFLPAIELERFLGSHPEMLDATVYRIYVQSILPTLLPRSGTWQIERHLPSGKIEISKNWWFRGDGMCGNEGIAGTWCAADYGQLIVKANEEFTFIFSDVQPGHFTGTVYQGGSSVAAKTVWWTEVAQAQEARRRQAERLAQMQEEQRRQADRIPRYQEEQ
jgi:hypothetical protein